VCHGSTQGFDLSTKFDDYAKIVALEEYVVISQDRQRVECRRRTGANTWDMMVYQEGDRVWLQSLDLAFAIASLYQGLDG